MKPDNKLPCVSISYLLLSNETHECYHFCGLGIWEGLS